MCDTAASEHDVFRVQCVILSKQLIAMTITIFYYGMPKAV